MKTRILLYTLISSLIFAMLILWINSTTRASLNEKTFDAMVNSDCAPWDGVAFTISIPYQLNSVIEISIWQSPILESAVSFTFPDRTGSRGNAIYRPATGLAEGLSGKISIQPFEVGMPVEGRFNFTSERGVQLIGAFIAQWGSESALCG